MVMVPVQVSQCRSFHSGGDPLAWRLYVFRGRATRRHQRRGTAARPLQRQRRGWGWHCMPCGALVGRRFYVLLLLPPPPTEDSTPAVEVSIPPPASPCHSQLASTRATPGTGTSTTEIKPLRAVIIFESATSRNLYFEGEEGGNESRVRPKQTAPHPKLPSLPGLCGFYVKRPEA
jgi:hypothetical protein